MKHRHYAAPSSGRIEHSTGDEWRTAFGPHSETQIVLRRDDCADKWGYEFAMCDSVHADCNFWWNGNLDDLEKLAGTILSLIKAAKTKK